MIQGLGLQVQGLGFSFKVYVQGLEFRVTHQGLEFTLLQLGLGYRVEGFRFTSLGFKDFDLGFKFIYGLGFKVSIQFFSVQNLRFNFQGS